MQGASAGALVLLCAPAGALVPQLLDWFKNSEFVARKHAEHRQSESVVHMMKGTVLAAAPDDKKLEFADSWAGRGVAEFMRQEQVLLGDWKVSQILDAAGLDADALDAARADLDDLRRSAPVVVFSFEDCPWCVAARTLLTVTLGLPTPDVVNVIELEPLGRRGKALRAALALATGRTSLPNVFIGDKSVGGHTDGYAESPPPSDDYAQLVCHDGSPGLQRLYESGVLERMLRDAGVAGHEEGSQGT